MKNLLLSALCGLGLAALLPETAHAHGGQYRGPGDTVPPAPGGGGGGRTGGPAGPSTGGPAGPSTGGPAGPSTGGPGGPSTGGPAATGGAPPAAGTTGGPRGGALQDDLTTWNYWWEFNKDPYIRLRDAVVANSGVTTGDDGDFPVGSTLRPNDNSSLRPSAEMIQGEILPALKKAIDSTEQRDINSSCMVAMAKIGVDHPDFTLRSV
ncbi:MAG: hypothetical protein JNL12_21705, partial [Planctomycetes bacterium]|nr:hypothetical protein [Planctomycetota bacterium]